MQNQELRKFAILGYILDIYKIAMFNFTNPHSLTKFFLIKKLQKTNNLSCMIETGTYLGVTTNRCSFIFDQVYTIELSKELAAKADEFLEKRKNVEVICGDALEILPILMKRVTNKALIFLDGHFSGGDTSKTDVPEPAIAELKILADFKDKIGAIVIDDFRSFGKETGFPLKSELLKSAETYFDNYEIFVHLDQLILVAKK